MQRFEQQHSDDLRFVCQSGEHDVWISKDHEKLISRHGNDPCEYGILSRELFRSMVKNARDEKLIKDLNDIPYYKIWNILLDNPDWTPIN